MRDREYYHYALLPLIEGYNNNGERENIKGQDFWDLLILLDREDVEKEFKQ